MSTTTIDTDVLIWRGREGVSWQRGEREVEGSLY